MNDLDRFLDFERRILPRMSTRTERFDHGTAYFDDDVRERYISNFLLIDRHQPQVSAETLIEDADRILGGGGYRHRLLVVVDEADGDRLAPGFRAQGYVAEPSVQMVLRRPPDRPADLAAEECSFAESRPLTEEIYRRDTLTPDLNQRFVDQHASWGRSIGARRFVARIDGTLAGECELYIDGAEAQVEFVDTLEEFRGRGVARAVVLGAAEAAREAGADRVFILADENDWPKELYRRLGFDPMARRWEVQKYPEA